MLFHEIYGCYYNAVAEILRQAVNGELTEKSMQEIIEQKAFSESFLTIIPSLTDQKWQLLKNDLSTPIKNEPSLPLSDLQKRWLKAVSLLFFSNFFVFNLNKNLRIRSFVLTFAENREKR